MPRYELYQLDADRYRVKYQGRYVEISNVDFHAMGKQQLGEIVGNFA
jgi:hypothetical protein